MREFTTTMQEVKKAIDNKRKLSKLGFKTEIGEKLDSEKMTISKISPNGIDWIEFRIFYSLSEYNVYAEIILQLMRSDPEDSDSLLFDELVRLRGR